MVDRSAALVRTFVQIVEAEGFDRIGSEPDSEIELGVDRRLAMMNTLLRRLHMRGDCPLPLTVDDADSVKLEWFDIMLQTCGEGGTFFQPRAQGKA